MTAPRPDAVVVGAGVVGAAVARALVREGMRVDVLEAAFAGSGATAAGMGHIVVMDDSPAQLALTARSRALLLEIAGQLSASCEVDRCGTLWIAEDAGQLDAVHAKHALLAANAVASEVLDGAAVAAAEPELRPGLAGALRVPDDLVVYPPGLARWLLDAEAGPRLRVLRGVEVTGFAARAALTTAGRVEADAVINAAGAAAVRLTPQLPIVPRKGHLLITDRYAGFCRHQLVELGYLKSAHTMTAESVAFNVQPRRTGQLLIGSSRELVGWDPSVNRRLLGRMLSRALEFLPRLGRLSAIRVWTGFRPATQDKLPLIGPWEPVDGLWIAAGHEGLGITTALATAELLSELITGRVPTLDPAPYAAGRLLGAAAPMASSAQTQPTAAARAGGAQAQTAGVAMA
jgi:D-hydroxyproline dehydrogenase subunit beta